MIARMRILVGLAFFAAFSSAQAKTPAPAPAFTYTLHAQKEFRKFCFPGCLGPPYTVTALTPENALLVLIPQAHGNWVLKRLTAWDSQSPQEATLSFTGDPPHDKHEGITEDLTVNPDGTYLIVRITSDYTSHGELTLTALLILVDLHSFSIVLRRSTTDPLIASSEVHFNNNGLLVAQGIVKVNRTAATTAYAAGVLTLPDFQLTTSCRYERELRSENNRLNWITSQNANSACAAVLQAAGVSSVENLPGSDHRGEISKLLNIDYCSLNYLSRDEKLALYNCGKSYADGSFQFSRASKVISVSDKKTVLSIPLPVTQSVDGLLAADGTQNYLLLLRDGIRLETYRIN